MPLPYLHCAPPLPLLRNGKEKEDQRVFNHTLKLLRREEKKTNTWAIWLSDSFEVTLYSCWSCHQHELVATRWRVCILPEEHRSAGRCRWDTGAGPAPGPQRPPAWACVSGISGLARFSHSHPGVGPLPSSQNGCSEDENWAKGRSERERMSALTRRSWRQNQAYQSANPQRSQDQR